MVGFGLGRWFFIYCFYFVGIRVVDVIVFVILGGGGFGR